jgi:Zn-dependent protease
MLLFAVLSGQLSPIEFVGIILGILMGVTVHEYAHAYIALKNGDPTAKYEGRLSFNPFAHLDMTGTIMLLLVGFGWGKPVPINPNNFEHKTSELKVAFAGIITNIIFAFIIAIPIRIAILNGHIIDSSPTLIILNSIVEINLILAAFNLIPIPPLDGSHLIEYFLNEDQKFTYQSIGPSVLIGLILLSFLTNFSFFQIVVEPVVRFLSALVEGTSLLVFLH